MAKRFEVICLAGVKHWRVSQREMHPREMPAEFRAFDSNAHFRSLGTPCSIVYIDDTLRMLVAVDWLLERDWELDLSRCDAAFLAVYPVTAQEAK